MNDFYLEEKNGVVTLKCAAFADVEGLRHGFSTRRGGVSCGDYAAMNFSVQREPGETVEENYRRFCTANGLPFESLALTDQVHSATVVTVGKSEKNRGRYCPVRETDGLVTAEARLGLVCFTADCVPVLLADSQNHVAAAVHSGWRGTVGNIVGEAVQKMIAAGAETEHILAAIGPAIGPCCFEVGPEVQDAFDRQYGDALPHQPSHRPGHTMVDLWSANRLNLLGAGLSEPQIFVSEVCTVCQHELYYSHRYTNGRRGSLIAAIAWEE